MRATATRLPRVESAARTPLPTPTAYAAAGGAGWCLGRETVERAVAAIRRGRPVIVTDDADRENEGDLIFAAAHATPETMAFVVRHTSGVVCVALPGDRLDDLRLGPMVADNEDPKGTAFAVSVDLRGAPMTTGISASDRARTLRALADATTGPDAFCRPGHVFPLRARPGGVLERGGHTEAAVDLAVLAGLAPAGALCEVVRDADGEMSRWDDLAKFAADHDLVLTTIADLQEYRRQTEPGAAGAPPPRHYPDAPAADVTRVARTRMPTSRGEFAAICYQDRVANVEHLALLKGDVGTASQHAADAPAAAAANGARAPPADAGPPLVRIHSECATGDIFGSRRCDCGEQLDIALRDVQAAGRGVVLYVRGHEGRGIGLAAKLAAYELQDAGRDTVEANVDLGHPIDARSYAAAAAILLDLGIDEVRLMTNNPAKCDELRDAGITVAERVPVITTPNADNLAYLRTKQKRLGHLLQLPDEGELQAP